MKKIIIFLITLIALLPANTYAKVGDFYEGEYINNVWMNRVTPDGKTIFYQKARMFRETGTNRIAYCIEPFTMFNENGHYEATITPSNLTEEQKERIKYLAYFGYGNKNRENEVWYAVTQLLIWQTAEPNGKYYFTDSLNGNKINTYQSLIDDLNTTIENYKNNISFKNEYSLVVGEKLEIIAENDFFTNYSTDNKYTTITGNKIIIENLPVGTHEIIITKNETKYDLPIIFYQSANSQNIMTLGNIDPIQIKLLVKVKDTTVKVTKQDYDTNSTTPSGKAKLEGAIYQIYDKDMNKVTKLEIDKTSTVSIKNLPYGKYYIKEIKAGEGYKLDENIYSFELSESTNEINLFLKNKVIKGKIKINKVYIENNQELPEPNISFNIYDEQNKLITTITTDETGTTEIELPYGTYLIEQKNTTVGYQYIEPFTVTINNEETLTYNLKNYKIPVPNTYIENTCNKILQIIKFLLKLIGKINDYKIIDYIYIN